MRRNRRLIALLSTVVALIVLLAVTHLFFSVRPATAGPLGKQDIVVLCSSCTIPQDSNHGYLIIMDQDSGEVWAYRELTLQPIKLGKLKIGSPIQQPPTKE